MSVLFSLYTRSLSTSLIPSVSLAISMYALGRLIVDLPVGMFADRFGRKPLMIVGTVLLTVTAYLNAIASDFWEFLVYRLIQGVGSSMWMTSRTTLLADILKPEERGRTMGYFQAFMLLGSSAGPVVGGIVATGWGIRAPFYFYALAGLVSLIITVIWIREPQNVRERHLDQDFSYETVRRLMCNRSYSMACLATFTVFLMRTGIRGTMVPLYANVILGFDELTIGMIISYATITNLLMTIPSGYAVDYFGRKPPIIASLVITAISAFLFPSTSDYFQVSLVAVLLGVGTSGAGQAPLALATDATIDEPHGLCMGLYRLFGDLGFVVGPIILGLIADSYGLRAPFYFITALILVNAVLVGVFARETYSAKRNQSDRVLSL